MILHLVTDRRRLGPDQTEAARCACLLEQARFAVAAEIDVIQLREGDLDGGQLATLAAAIVAVTHGTSTRAVVNDRLDVALAAGAHGVHLRGDSFEATQVRSIVAPGFLIGRSVHSLPEVHRAGPVDYIVAGTVWATPSKGAGHPLLGPDGLAEIVAASPVPVIGIGGPTARTGAGRCWGGGWCGHRRISGSRVRMPRNTASDRDSVVPPGFRRC